MSRLLFGFAALSLGACGPEADLEPQPEPLYTTSDGVMVFPSETGFAFPQNEVELTLAITFEHFSAATHLAEASVAASAMGLSIVHEDPPIITPWGSEVAAYYQEDPLKVVISRADCVGLTPLPHELIHVLHQPFFGDSDDHPPQFFGGAGTPEQLAWHEVREELCP